MEKRVERETRSFYAANMSCIFFQMNLFKVGFSFLNRSSTFAPRLSQAWIQVPGQDYKALRTSPPEKQTDLAPGQIVITENNEKKNLLSMINKQIREDGTGRLFSVVFLRGKQHKVTSGP